MKPDTPYFVQHVFNLHNGNTYRQDTVGVDVLKAYELLTVDMQRPGYVAQIIIDEGHVKLVPLHSIDTIDVVLVEGTPQFPWDS